MLTHYLPLALALAAYAWLYRSWLVQRRRSDRLKARAEELATRNKALSLKLDSIQRDLDLYHARIQQMCGNGRRE